jgi:TPR repeat protein
VTQYQFDSLLRLSKCFLVAVFVATVSPYLNASEELNQQGIEAYHQQKYDLAREKFEASCKLGTLISCASMADLLFRGLGGEQNVVEARRLSQLGCDGDIHYSCALLAHLTQVGQGGEQNAAESLRLHLKACNLGNAGACNRAAHVFFDKQKGNTDKNKARTLFQFACLGGDANGCESLAQLHHSGDGIPRNRERARVYFDQGCEYGSGRSCFNFAAYNDAGTGGVRDLTVARHAFKKSCDLRDSDGCLHYARYLHQGTGGARDLGAAESMLRSLCEVSVKNSCLSLAELLDDDRHDPSVKEAKSKEAILLFRKLCDDGVQRACSNGLVSRLYRLGDGSTGAGKITELHFSSDLFSGLLKIDKDNWPSKSDQQTLRQAADRFFADIISANSFDKLEKVVGRDEDNGMHNAYCSLIKLSVSRQRTQTLRDSLEMNRYLEQLVDLQLEVDKDRQFWVATQQRVLRRNLTSLDRLIDSRGRNIIANLELIGAELELTSNKRNYATLNELYDDIEQRVSVTDQSVKVLDARAQELAERLGRSCELAEFHWLDENGKTITVVAVDSSKKTEIINIEIPHQDLTIVKLWRQFIDADSLKVNKSVDFVKGLLTYANYSN